MKARSPVRSTFPHGLFLVSEVTLIQDQGQFAVYSTQRITGVKWKNGGWNMRTDGVFALTGMRPIFDQPASPWYGLGDFPLSQRSYEAIQIPYSAK